MCSGEVWQLINTKEKKRALPAFCRLCYDGARQQISKAKRSVRHSAVKREWMLAQMTRTFPLPVHPQL